MIPWFILFTNKHLNARTLEASVWLIEYSTIDIKFIKNILFQLIGAISVPHISLHNL